MEFAWSASNTAIQCDPICADTDIVQLAATSSSKSICIRLFTLITWLGSVDLCRARSWFSRTNAFASACIAFSEHFFQCSAWLVLNVCYAVKYAVVSPRRCRSFSLFFCSLASLWPLCRAVCARMPLSGTWNRNRDDIRKPVLECDFSVLRGGCCLPCRCTCKRHGLWVCLCASVPIEEFGTHSQGAARSAFKCGIYYMLMPPCTFAQKPIHLAHTHRTPHSQYKMISHKYSNVLEQQHAI